jgi:hypothetical protein
VSKIVIYKTSKIHRNLFEGRTHHVQDKVFARISPAMKIKRETTRQHTFLGKIIPWCGLAICLCTDGFLNTTDLKYREDINSCTSQISALLTYVINCHENRLYQTERQNDNYEVTVSVSIIFPLTIIINDAPTSART